MVTAITEFKLDNIGFTGVNSLMPVLFDSPQLFKANPQMNKDEFLGNNVEIDPKKLTTKSAKGIKSYPYKIWKWKYETFDSKDPYQIEDNKGINTGKGVTKEDICLAKYAKAVSDDLSTYARCYTGVKHSLWSAGVLNDYADVPGNKAKAAIKYFDNNPDKFEKLDVKKEDLKNLPAGRIIVYKKDSEPNLPGHIAITNGNGQEMSDNTDNMGWLERHSGDADFSVYKLTDNWTYDRQTKQLKYKGKKD